MTPVMSLVTGDTITTFYSHQGHEQVTGDFLEARGDIASAITTHADLYYEQGIREFKMYHQTEEDLDELWKEILD